MQGAFDKAQKDMADEALQKRLNSLVQQGKITQDQADQYGKWYQSRPSVPLPGMGPIRPFAGTALVSGCRLAECHHHTGAAISVDCKLYSSIARPQWGPGGWRVGRRKCHRRGHSCSDVVRSGNICNDRVIKSPNRPILGKSGIKHTFDMLAEKERWVCPIQSGSGIAPAGRQGN